MNPPTVSCTIHSITFTQEHINALKLMRKIVFSAIDQCSLESGAIEVSIGQHYFSVNEMVEVKQLQTHLYQILGE